MYSFTLKKNQKMTILYLYKPAKLPRSLKQLPPIRRALRCCPPLRAKRSRFRSEFLRHSDRGSPPRARALHGLGQLIRKSAPCAVRTDRRNGAGHAIGHRRAAASCREQRLQGGAPQTSIFSLQMHRPSPPQPSRRLREALKSCSQRHLIYSMPRNYWASQPRRKLDHPNRSCRRLHGLGVAHRCTQSQECFMRVFQSRPNTS